MRPRPCEGREPTVALYLRRLLSDEGVQFLPYGRNRHVYRCIVDTARRIVVAVWNELRGAAQQLLDFDQRDQEAVRVVLPSLLDLVAALEQVGAVRHRAVPPEKAGESAHETSQSVSHDGTQERAYCVSSYKDVT